MANQNEGGVTVGAVSEIVPVTEASDPALVELRDLTDTVARRRSDVEHGCFIIEGILALETAVDTGWPVRKVLVAEGRLERIRPLLERTDAVVYVTTNAVVRDLVGFPFHRGVFAVGDRRRLAAVSDLVASADRVLVVEGVTDHENVGSLFRNAAAFGVDAVLIDEATADPMYRRSVRVSLGHVLRVPWTRCRLPDEVARLHSAGLTTVALTPSGDEVVGPLPDSARVAWMVGAEGSGLSNEVLAESQRRARIPMATGVDSLNVATATAVALALALTPDAQR